MAAPPSLADTVCSLGDSITAGARRLRTKLYTDYHPGWTYVGNAFDGKWYHDGVAGDTSSGVVRRLGTLPECDLALVMIGTNDFPWITADRTLANLQSIVDYLRSRGTRVYLQTLLPRCDIPVANDWVALLNYRIKREIIGAQLLDTGWAALASGLSQEVFFTDCLHPSLWGYDALARYIGPRT